MNKIIKCPKCGESANVIKNEIFELATVSTQSKTGEWIEKNSLRKEPPKWFDFECNDCDITFGEKE